MINQLDHYNNLEIKKVLILKQWSVLRKCVNDNVF